MRIFLVLLLLPCFCPGQNVVSNPSFEVHSGCPTQFSTFQSNQLDKATPWDLATLGTADYFNQCNDTIDSTVSVPANFNGNQLARTGIAYTGLYTFFSSTPDYREYITAPLNTALISGLKYYIELYVSLADKPNWNCATDGIGVHFSVGPPDSTGVGMFVFPLVPQVSNPIGNLLTDSNNWTRIYGIFNAAGGEDYITIGNFKDDASTQNNCGGANNSYYYIDDICVSRDSLYCTYPIGIDKYEESHQVTTYPNPTTGVATITNGEQPITNIEVFDLFGRPVPFQFDIGRSLLDIRSCPAGVYFIKAGETVRKLIKQ